MSEILTSRANGAAIDQQDFVSPETEYVGDSPKLSFNYHAIATPAQGGLMYKLTLNLKWQGRDPSGAPVQNQAQLVDEFPLQLNGNSESAAHPKIELLRINGSSQIQEIPAGNLSLRLTQNDDNSPLILNIQSDLEVRWIVGASDISLIADS